MKNADSFLIVSFLLTTVQFITGCSHGGTWAEVLAQPEMKYSNQENANAIIWKLYKEKAEQNIRLNEVRIIELKRKIKKYDNGYNELYARKIEMLEQKTCQLKYKINNYRNNNCDWLEFNIEFTRDMYELDNGFDSMVEAKRH